MKELNERLKNNKICLSYLGSFDDDITDKLISISEFYLENRSELGKMKNKVSFLIAECFQNIVRHGSTKEKSEAVANVDADFFQLNVKEDRSILTSCNSISKELVASLEEKLIQVNSLDADGLKKLYASVMTNTGFSEKGGAGLGLIEMARKSGLPLKYQFKDLGGDRSSFFLSLEIIAAKDNLVSKVKMQDIVDIYDLLTSKKIVMLYKGDMSKDIIVPLVEMVETNFEDKDHYSGNEKRSLITLIESLQNIAKHGKIINGIREGIFTMIKNKNSYTIEVGNPIEKKDLSILQNSLLEIKNMSQDDIRSLYKKRLVNPEITAEGNCGLGLLEIARNSTGKFEYDFSSINDDQQFYSLKITV